MRPAGYISKQDHLSHRNWLLIPFFPYAEVFISELLGSCCARDSTLQSNRQYICLPLTKSRWEKLWTHKPSVIKHLENRAWHGEIKKREQSSLLQGIEQSGISYRNSNYKLIPSVVGLSPRLSAPFSSSLTICSSGASFYCPDLSVSGTLLLSSWQPRQKIRDIHGKRMVWQVVDPRGMVTSPSGSKQPCGVLLLQVSIKTNTEMNLAQQLC